MNSTQSTVARWEAGEHDYTVKTLARIADALQLDLTIELKPREASE